MRDRTLALGAVAGAIVCCGAMSLIAGLFGGVALAAIGRFTVVSVAGLSVVGAVAWRLARHRHRNGLDDRPVHLEGTQR